MAENGIPLTLLLDYVQKFFFSTLIAAFKLSNWVNSRKSDGRVMVLSSDVYIWVSQFFLQPFIFIEASRKFCAYSSVKKETFMEREIHEMDYVHKCSQRNRIKKTHDKGEGQE